MHINVNLLKIGNQTCYAKINYQKRYAYIYTEHFSASNQHYITHFLPRSLADSLSMMYHTIKGWFGFTCVSVFNKICLAIRKNTQCIEF